MTQGASFIYFEILQNVVLCAVLTLNKEIRKVLNLNLASENLERYMAKKFG